VTRIACQQLAPVIGDLAANREIALDAIREAVADGADVVVLPELITSGYMFESTEEAAAVAIGAGHEILLEWGAEAARADIVLAGGFCELGEDGRIYNSAAVLDATGLRTVYRKLHLWDREKLVFTPGSAPPPVLETRIGRLAVIICYDLEFPELTRSVALAGTQLLLVPTNWPLVPRPGGERPPEALIAMAAARVNRMAVACADRVGLERGQEWTGGTTIIGVDGWVAAESRGSGLVAADVDLAAALDKRLTENADAFGDRRPGLYAALTRTDTQTSVQCRFT
jgi:predicted amidohydrolase